MGYDKTQWVNGQTRLNATNLNHLEGQYDAALEDMGSRLGVLWDNINPATMRAARAAFARARAGIASAKVLCVGDSTTIGGGATVAQSYPTFLIAALDGTTPTRSGLSIPPLQGPSVDPRWSFNGWVVVTSFGWGDGCALMSDGTVSGAATFTPDVEVDTFDIYYYGTGGYGTMHVTLESGEQLDINAGGAGGTVRKATITAATASVDHVLSFTNTTELPLAVLGVDAYLSSERSVRVGNAGVNGATSARWGNAMGTPTGYGSASAIRTYAPDLTIVMLGINDAMAGVTPAQLRANLVQTIAAASASGSVVLMSVVPSADDAAAALESGYRDALSDLATTTGAGYIDILGRFESYDVSEPFGLYFNDGIHPSATGYADIANAVAAALRTI